MRAMTPRRLPLGVQSSRSRSPTGSICSPPEPDTAWPARNASTAGADFDGANSQLDRLTESTSARSPGRYAFGLTGRGPDGKVLEPGTYVLRLRAQPVDAADGTPPSTADTVFRITTTKGASG